MLKPSGLRILLAVLLLALMVFGCAHPKAITKDNRNTPIDGAGFSLMPPKSGSQWRYGVNERLGLVGFYKRSIGDDRDVTFTLVQSWVAPAGIGQRSCFELCTMLLSAYKHTYAESYKLKITRHEVTELEREGQTLSKLQIWGTHEDLPRKILTKIVRFNAVFYAIPHPGKNEGGHIVLGGWKSRMTQGEDNPGELKTDWGFVEEMISGVLPAPEGSSSITYLYLNPARPFYLVEDKSDGVVTFYNPLQ